MKQPSEGRAARTIFIVELQYNVSREEREGAHAAHAAYLGALSKAGKLLLAGPVVGQNAGLLVYELEDEQALSEVLANEPYVQAGHVAETTIKAWAPGKGYLAEHLRSQTNAHSAIGANSQQEASA